MDTYDYLDRLEEPDDEELQRIEKSLSIEKFKTEYADNIDENIDDMTIEFPTFEFSRSENGYKRATSYKKTGMSLLTFLENKKLISNLQNHGIFTVDDILCRTRREIQTYEFVGTKETEVIANKLYSLGLTFAYEKIYTCTKCNATFLGYKNNDDNILCPVCHILEKNKRNLYYIKPCYESTYKSEFKELLSYIDSFVYDFENEEIMIKNSSDAISAITSYQYIIDKYIQNDVQLKWCFDIALNCVRETNNNDRTFLRENYNIDFLQYGLYVRNKYIHSAKKLPYMLRGADTVSGIVIGLISTLCHSYYNYFNTQLCSILNDFEYRHIKKCYGKKFLFIYDYTMFLTQPECTLTADNVLKAIELQIRDELGSDGFKKSISQAAKSIKDNILAQWEDFLNVLYNKGGCVYKKEYNQLKALKAVGFFQETIIDGAITKRRIVENLGLADNDAQYIAECVYELKDFL